MWTSRSLDRGAHPKRRQPVAPIQRLPGHETGEKIQRRSKQWTREPRGAARPIDDVDDEPILYPHVGVSADAAEKREGVRAIAAKQHVLAAVVDAFARRGIGERARAARPSAVGRVFENEHAHAVLGECGGSAQPREAAADHDHVGRQRLNIARAQSRSAITAR